MKKIFLLTTALAAALCANAEYLEVHHTTSGQLEAELNAAMTAAGLTADQVTELKVISDLDAHDNPVELNVFSYTAAKNEDCAAIRKLFKTTLKKVDFSEAVFAGNQTGESSNHQYFMNGMAALEECILPDELVTLCSFCGCTNLKSFNWPAHIRNVGKGCFSGCVNLTIGNFPNTVTFIGDNVFDQDSKPKPKITMTELPASLEKLGGAVFKGQNITFTTLPETLKEIGREAFYETNCTFSVLPPNLEKIGMAAFRAAPVSFHSIPESVTTFEKEAFILCDNITDFELTGILLNEVPDRSLYINNKTVKRTFTSRGLQAPKITLMSAGDWAGSFGREKEVLNNTTFRILKDAEDNYITKEPWNQMKIEFLTTPVEISIVGTGADVAINHQHYADKVFTAGTHDIYEGTHTWTLTPSNSSYYITTVTYEETEPAAAPRKRVITADDNEVADQAEEPVTGKQTLYKAEGTPAVGFIPVQVNVPVTAKAGKLSVEYAYKSESTTGIDDINAEAAFVRNGNIISVTDGTATLYDLTGKVITTAAEIDMTNLNTGVYILRCGARSLKIAR